MDTIVLNENINAKIINISKKRQITLPLKFFNELGFNNEAECFIRNGEIVIRPYSRNEANTYFSEQILKELIKEGYNGEELLLEFKKRSEETNKAIKKMLSDADNVAKGKSEYETYEDVFKK